MTWIPKNREDALHRAGVRIAYVGRNEKRAWKEANPDEVEHLFAGFYYHQERRGRPITAPEGPFRSWSGAAQHAYKALGVQAHEANVLPLRGRRSVA